MILDYFFSSSGISDLLRIDELLSFLFLNASILLIGPALIGSFSSSAFGLLIDELTLLGYRLDLILCNELRSTRSFYAADCFDSSLISG
jgi:hypothetical protein